MKRLEFVHINRNCVEFAGYGARELHAEATGRPPVYNSRTRRWVTSPRRIPNLVALAESRGWEVRLDRTLLDASTTDVSPAMATPAHEQIDPADSLW